MAPVDVGRLSQFLADYLQNITEIAGPTTPPNSSTYGTSGVTSSLNGTLAEDLPLGPVYFILAYLLFNTFTIFSCMIVNGIYKKTSDYEMYKTYFGKASTSNASKKARARSKSQGSLVDEVAVAAGHHSVLHNLPKVRPTRSKRRRFHLPKLQLRPPIDKDEEKEYNNVAYIETDDPRYWST